MMTMKTWKHSLLNFQDERQNRTPVKGVKWQKAAALGVACSVRRVASRTSGNAAKAAEAARQASMQSQETALFQKVRNIPQLMWTPF